MQYWDNKTIDRIRKGYYSAVYFNRTKQILLAEKKLISVTMQIFQKNENALLCGMEEVRELLKVGTGYFDKNTWIDMSSKVKVYAVPEGQIVKPFESVIHINGPYAYFAHLESLYLGILARRTRVATRVRDVVSKADKKPVFFFADRFDYFLNQEGDGYAARLGGINGVSTAAQAFLWHGQPIGTIPHALIASYAGNVALAAEMFAKHYPEAKLIVLADFTNDCVETSVMLAKKLGKKLWGVRLDTSESLIDKSVARESDQAELLRGVSPLLVTKVRHALDNAGFPNIKIIVSGGFTKEKIELFEKKHVPVDAYGIGSSLLQGSNDFTADIVKVGNKFISKTGRKFQKNPRMEKIF